MPPVTQRASWKGGHWAGVRWVSLVAGNQTFPHSLPATPGIVAGAR